jgi:hypothetical protein
LISASSVFSLAVWRAASANAAPWADSTRANRPPLARAGDEDGFFTEAE